MIAGSARNNVPAEPSALLYQTRRSRFAVLAEAPTHEGCYLDCRYRQVQARTCFCW